MLASPLPPQPPSAWCWPADRTEKSKGKAKDGSEDVGAGSAQGSLESLVLHENKNVNLRSSFEAGSIQHAIHHQINATNCTEAIYCETNDMPH